MVETSLFRKHDDIGFADSADGLYARGFKRLFDLVFGLVLSLCLAPVIFVLWALVRMDGHAGFFVQTRVGRDGKHFKLWKLRTMYVDAEDRLTEMCAKDPEVAAEWERHQKLKNDPRTTKVGKFLRKTSLDELPQLWNVLKGDMSFVGPRPMLVSQEAMYRATGCGESYFKLRPGITGFWQIYGRSKTSFADRAGFDDQYAESLSFWNDLKFIALTIPVVAFQTGT